MKDKQGQQQKSVSGKALCFADFVGRSSAAIPGHAAN
jgi:hypothetical protein